MKSNQTLHIIEAKRQQISVEAAVSSYLFNSQIVTLPNKAMVLIAPTECEANLNIRAFIEELHSSESNPLQAVYYLDLKQSMQNGGGPACLRLRVVLNETQLQAMHQAVLVDDLLLDQLEAWFHK